MATNRIIPPRPEQLMPKEVQAAGTDPEIKKQARTRRLEGAVRAGAIAQMIIALSIVLVICYVGKVVLVTLLLALLLAFVLEPIVTWLERIRLPRAVSWLLAILLLLGIVWAGSYFFYNRAVSFVQDLPKYSQKFRGITSHLRQKTNQLEKSTENILPKDAKPRNVVPVSVQDSGGTGLITRHLAAMTEIAAMVGFIPFLVYFMLSWQEHARTKTVQLFRPEHRTTAYVTLGQISLMMRSFISGNFIIGLFMGVASVMVFGLLHLQYFYFIGFISGFLSLVPYLGVILAILPPLGAGIGSLSLTGIIIVCATVLGLHVFSMNVLYPKVIGKRLQLNPLVVTLSLLLWGWIWGAMGLILAVPIMGAIKIVCDHVDSLRPIGAWMGE